MFKIAKLDAVAISVPLKSPLKLAGIVIGTADNLIVRIEDTDGTIGWGEASSAPTMTGEFPEGMVSAAKFLKEHLLGFEVTNIGNFHRQLDPVIYGNSSVKSAIEMALVDIAGQRQGIPAYEVLGGRVRDKVAIILMVAGGGGRDELNSAKEHADRGFVAYKVKVGVGDVTTDIQRCRDMRNLLGPEMRISADANQGFNRTDALTFAEAAGDTGLDFFEQPVNGEDLDTMRDCAEISTIPLGADEGFHSIDDIIKHHEIGAASGGSLKTIKLGGMFPVIQAGTLMNNLGMNVNLAGKIADTSIASSSVAHLAMALPKLNWDVNITNHYLCEDIVENPLSIEDGHVTISDAPGLGFRPDESLLNKYTAIR